MRVTIDLAPGQRNEISLPRIVPTGLLGYDQGGTRYRLSNVLVGVSDVLAAETSRTR